MSQRHTQRLQLNWSGCAVWTCNDLPFSLQWRASKPALKTEESSRVASANVHGVKTITVAYFKQPIV